MASQRLGGCFSTACHLEGRLDTGLQADHGEVYRVVGNGESNVTTSDSHSMFPLSKCVNSMMDRNLIGRPGTYYGNRCSPLAEKA